MLPLLSPQKEQCCVLSLAFDRVSTKGVVRLIDERKRTELEKRRKGESTKWRYIKLAKKPEISSKEWTCQYIEMRVYITAATNVVSANGSYKLIN